MHGFRERASGPVHHGSTCMRSTQSRGSEQTALWSLCTLTSAVRTWAARLHGGSADDAEPVRVGGRP